MSRSIAAVAALALLGSTLAAAAQGYVTVPAPGDTSSSGNVGPGTSNNGNWGPSSYNVPVAPGPGVVVVDPAPSVIVVGPEGTTGMASGGGSGITSRGGANGTGFNMPRTTTGPQGDASQAESPAK